MILKVQSNKCAIIDDVYKYTTREGILATVPFVVFKYKNPPKSDEEYIERLKESNEKLYLACLHDFKTNGQEENKELCQCYADNFIENLISEEYSLENFKENIEKKCGKLPEFL